MADGCWLQVARAGGAAAHLKEARWEHTCIAKGGRGKHRQRYDSAVCAWIRWEEQLLLPLIDDGTEKRPGMGRCIVRASHTRMKEAGSKMVSPTTCERGGDDARCLQPRQAIWQGRGARQ